MRGMPMGILINFGSGRFSVQWRLGLWANKKQTASVSFRRLKDILWIAVT